MTTSPFITTAEAIAINTFLPILVAALKNVQANSSIENLVAQGPALAVQLQAALPNLQQQETAFLAGQLQTVLTNAAASLPVPPTT